MKRQAPELEKIDAIHISIEEFVCICLFTYIYTIDEYLKL